LECKTKMSERHENIDSDGDFPEIPYREEFADAALARYRKAVALRRLLKFSTLAVMIILTGIGITHFTKSNVSDSLAQVPLTEGPTANEKSTTAKAEQLSEIISNNLQNDSASTISAESKNNSKKIIPTPKDLKTPLVLQMREGSELENPAVGLSVAVSSGVATSERQPVLFPTETSQHSDFDSNENHPTPLLLKSARLSYPSTLPNINIHRDVLPLVVSRLKPYIAVGVGGYSSLGVSRFKDPALSIGFDYNISSANIIYSAARAYTITGLNNPYVSSQKTYSDVSHEIRTTYQTDRLYMAGIEVGAGHRMGAYLVKAGMVADYVITGENTLTEEKLMNNEIISSKSSSDKGYINGFRDVSLAANLGISRQITSNISAGASIQFGLQDVTRNDVFISNNRHYNSLAQFFLKYQWQQ